jgi:hypothetical protein
MFGRKKKEDFRKIERGMDNEMEDLKRRAEEIMQEKERLRQEREERQREEDQYKKLGEREGDYPEKIDVGGVDYVRADVKDNPKEVTERFLKKVKRPKWYNPKSYVPIGWKGFFAPDIMEFKPKGNLLFLLDNEEGIRIFENVKPGVFRTKQYEGTTNERENFIILKANKLRTIRFDGVDEKTGEEKEDLWKCWVADINNFNAYPDDPLYSSEAVSEAIRRAIADRRAFDEGKKKGGIGAWLKYIAIGLVVVYVIYLIGVKYGAFEKLGLIKPAVDAMAQNSGATITNVPGGTVST